MPGTEAFDTAIAAVTALAKMKTKNDVKKGLKAVMKAIDKAEDIAGEVEEVDDGEAYESLEGAKAEIDSLVQNRLNSASFPDADIAKEMPGWVKEINSRLKLSKRLAAKGLKQMDSEEMSFDRTLVFDAERRAKKASR